MTTKTKQKVRIVLTSLLGQGQVFIDGVELQNVKGIKFSARAQDVNMCEIALMPSDVEIEGDAIVDRVPYAPPPEVDITTIPTRPEGG